MYKIFSEEIEFSRGLAIGILGRETSRSNNPNKRIQSIKTLIYRKHYRGDGYTIIIAPIADFKR